MELNSLQSNPYTVTHGGGQGGGAQASGPSGAQASGPSGVQASGPSGAQSTKNNPQLNEKAVLSLFNHTAALKKDDGRVSAHELYIDSSKVLDNGEKAEIVDVAAEQEIFEKYAGKDGKLNIDEYEAMCKDPSYEGIARKLGKGGIYEND